MADNINVKDAAAVTKAMQATDNASVWLPAHQITRADGTTPLKIIVEDVAHASGDTGILAMVVRADSAACTASVDGRNAALIVDADGKLWCNTQISAIIPGTGATSLGKAIDGVTGGTDTGVLSLATRDDALSGLTPAEGDNAQLRVDANGALWVGLGAALPSGTNVIGHIICDSGVITTVSTVTLVSTVTTVSTVTAVSSVNAVIPGIGATNLGKAVDAVSGATDTGVVALHVVDAALSAITPVDGDYAQSRLDANGALWVHSTGIEASENHIGEASDPRIGISITPTIDTNIYATGDAVGGKQALTNAARVSGGMVCFDSITIIDKGNQKAACDILIFDADPTAATITNNAAFVFSTDISKLVGIIHVAATTDWTTINSIAVCCLKNIGLTVKAAGSANLFAAVVGTGTPTYASTGDLIFKYSFTQS